MNPTSDPSFKKHNERVQVTPLKTTVDSPGDASPDVRSPSGDLFTIPVYDLSATEICRVPVSATGTTDLVAHVYDIVEKSGLERGDYHLLLKAHSKDEATPHAPPPDAAVDVQEVIAGGLSGTSEEERDEQNEAFIHLYVDDDALQARIGNYVLTWCQQTFYILCCEDGRLLNTGVPPRPRGNPFSKPFWRRGANFLRDEHPQALDLFLAADPSVVNILHWPRWLEVATAASWDPRVLEQFPDYRGDAQFFWTVFAKIRARRCVRSDLFETDFPEHGVIYNDWRDVVLIRARRLLDLWNMMTPDVRRHHRFNVLFKFLKYFGVLQKRAPNIPREWAAAHDPVRALLKTWEPGWLRAVHLRLPDLCLDRKLRDWGRRSVPETEFNFGYLQPGDRVPAETAGPVDPRQFHPAAATVFSHNIYQVFTLLVLPSNAFVQHLDSLHSDCELCITSCLVT